MKYKNVDYNNNLFHHSVYKCSLLVYNGGKNSHLNKKERSKCEKM